MGYILVTTFGWLLSDLQLLFAYYTLLNIPIWISMSNFSLQAFTVILTDLARQVTTSSYRTLGFLTSLLRLYPFNRVYLCVS